MRSYSVLDNDAGRGWDWVHIGGVPVFLAQFPVQCSGSWWDVGLVVDECKPATQQQQVEYFRRSFGPAMPQSVIDRAAAGVDRYLTRTDYQGELARRMDNVFTNPTNDPQGPLSLGNVAVWAAVAAAGVAGLMLLTRR